MSDMFLNSTLGETDVSSITEVLSNNNLTFANSTTIRTARVPFLVVHIAGFILSVYLLVSVVFFFISRYIQQH